MSVTYQFNILFNISI